MMGNLFIVNTTFQLLTAYIIARSNKETNFLIILLPPNHNDWSESTGLRKIIQDKTVWQDTITVAKWMERLKTAKEIKQHIKIMRGILSEFGAIDKVYLGCDKGYQRQLIVELTGNDQFYRIDEGIGSYWQPKRKRLSKLYLHLRVALIRYLAGVDTKLKYNFDGIGWSKSAVGDYLYQPELIARPANKVYSIPIANIQDAVSYLTEELDVSKYDPEGGSVWFLGSTLSEFNILTEEQEVEIIDIILKLTSAQGCRLIYKSHPSENLDKLERFQARFPTVQFFNSYDPVELFLCKCKNLRAVISYFTSTLIFVDQFRNNKVTKISTFKMINSKAYDINSLKIYNKILQRVGVELPESLEDLKKINI